MEGFDFMIKVLFSYKVGLLVLYRIHFWNAKGFKSIEKLK